MFALLVHTDESHADGSSDIEVEGPWKWFGEFWVLDGVGDVLGIGIASEQVSEESESDERSKESG